MKQRERAALAALPGDARISACGRVFAIRQLPLDDLRGLIPIMQIFSRSPSIAEFAKWTVAYPTIATLVLLEDGHPVAMGELGRLIGLEQMPAIAAEISRQMNLAAMEVPRAAHRPWRASTSWRSREGAAAN